MYTSHTFRWSIILRLVQRPLLFFFFYGIAAVAAVELLDWQFLLLPFTPVSAIGIAVVFYVGLKNSSSYERLWEARTIWGNLINASRLWGVQITHLVGPYTRSVQAGGDKPEHEPTEEEQQHLFTTQRSLVLRQLAFLNALRYQLRRKTWWAEDQKVGKKIAREEGDADKPETLLDAIAPYLDAEEAASYLGTPNAAVEILNRQSLEIRKLWAGRWIDSFHHVELLRIIGELFNGLGGSERIKTFPFPRQYATFSRVFIWLFALMLPFALAGEIKAASPDSVWMAVPVSVIISWVFMMMEVVGGGSENPFENSVNDVPITALCRIAEIDLRKMLGDTELPEKPLPVNDILM